MEFLLKYKARSSFLNSVFDTLKNNKKFKAKIDYYKTMIMGINIFKIYM